MSTDTAEQENFTAGPLYKQLVQWLPTFAQNPFDDDPTLNVQRLREAVGKSHEAVYKWLRASRLTAPNAKRLLELANSEENVRVLKSLGRTPPTIREFDQFVYAG